MAQTPEQIQAAATAARQQREERQRQTRENRADKSNALRGATDTLDATNRSLSRARVAARNAKGQGARVEAQTIVSGFEANRAEHRRAYDMALNRARRIGVKVSPEMLRRQGRAAGTPETPSATTEGQGRGPQAPRVTPNPDSGGGNPSSGGGSGSGGSGAKSTRSVTPRKRDFTVDQKNAKSNTVLGKALKMYGDPRKGPDKTGEMVQDGAKSPHHVKLTGKEFQDFKKKYVSTHAGGKNLSDWSLRAMAKMLKYKNTKSAKETYGLSEYKPPEG